MTYIVVRLQTDCKATALRQNPIIETATPIRLGSGDKLLILRRLDRDRKWESLDDRRYCLQCHVTFTGRQVDVVGGTRESGRLRLLCPTEHCVSTPKDWIYAPGESAGTEDPTSQGAIGLSRLLRAVRARA